MVLQHEFQEEFLDFHGIGVVNAKGSLEVSPCPPPNLFKRNLPTPRPRQGGVTACGRRRSPACRRIVDDVDICRS